MPALCKIFLDECAPDNVLEVTARAITYYLDVSGKYLMIFLYYNLIINIDKRLHCPFFAEVIILNNQNEP